MKIRKPNRRNAIKHKKGCGCKMCKPHKGGWTHKFKEKDRNQINNYESDAA